MSGERPVVAIPRSDGALIELFDELVTNRPATGGGVDGLVDRRELKHWNCDEADPIARRAHLVGERCQHLALPLAVLALLLAVADAKRHVVLGGVAKRAVT